MSDETDKTLIPKLSEEVRLLRQENHYLRQANKSLETDLNAHKEALFKARKYQLEHCD